MIILVLTFVTLFLAVFSPCLVILHKSEQTKELDALKQQQQRTAEPDGGAERGGLAAGTSR